jgi:hypothetical protein
VQPSDYIGQMISLAIPAIDANLIHDVKLLGVETGGIWVESQKLINMALRTSGQATAPQSPVFFFPYSEIRFGYVRVEVVALDERAFGV